METINTEKQIIIKTHLDGEKAIKALDCLATLDPSLLKGFFNAIDTGIEIFHINSYQTSARGASDI